MTAGPPRLTLALGLVAAGAAAVVVALFAVGGPGQARLERLDEARFRDVMELINAVERHRIYAGRLPETLDAMSDGAHGPLPLRDPGTGLFYDYSVLDESRFRICAILSAPGVGHPEPGPIRIGEQRRIARLVGTEAEGRACWETSEMPPG